jgi:uncharacterized protein with HEPN domain
MQPDDQDRLAHMIEAGETALRFMAGRPRTVLDQDEMLRFAVVRAIEIIGEAASKISPETRTAWGDIPWPAIIGMRNRLVHAYFDIDTDILWVAATQEVPALLKQLKSHQG